MGTLGSALDELAADDPRSQPYEVLRDDVVEISRALSRLTHELQRRTAEVAGRRDFARDGFVNPTRWLAVTADIDASAARRHVSAAMALDNTSITRHRFAAGDLSWWRTRLLAAAAATHVDEFRRDEAMLVDLAQDLTHRDFPRAVRYWMRCADEAAAEGDAAKQRERAYLHASVTFGGMVRVDGLLDQETGETLLTALDAATPAPPSGDTRPASHRRVEALGEICRQWLHNGTTNQGGVRPHVSLVVDLDTLEGRSGRRCDLARTGPTSAETARRILCDASVSRIITRGPSEPLDVGRATRTVTPAQRKALTIRDGGCRFRGCDRPPGWCDAHHIQHWLDHGPTDLGNLILLCRRHHTIIHEGAFAVRIRDGTVQIE